MKGKIFFFGICFSILILEESCNFPFSQKGLKMSKEKDALSEELEGFSGDKNMQVKGTYKDEIIEGDKKTLSKDDARFIDFYFSLKENFAKSGERFDKFLFSESLPSGKGEDTIIVNGVELKEINYKIITHPMSTGALTTKFWKSSGGEYFFSISGGCLTYKHRTFGPFKISGNNFVFSGKK